jgi:uncharacterized protein YbjQ (UPF0145 family)
MGAVTAFTSDLTVEEFAAVRSVGFTPVGQVMGSAVFNIGWTTTGCGYYTGYTRTWVSTPVMPVTGTQRLLSHARERAVTRMRHECAGLGGDGVVGVRLRVTRFHEIGMEFFAIGTAVRAAGAVRPRVPFTSDLTGQDFAKLLRAGWVPVALVQGVGALAQHGGRLRNFPVRSANQEIATTTRLVHAARDAARDGLMVDARHSGGTHVVLRDTVLQVFERKCGTAEGEDQVANAFMWGTAIVPYARRPVPELPLTMLRLNR